MLSGLSSAQHKWELVDSSQIHGTVAEGREEANIAVTAAVEPSSWAVDPHVDEEQVFDEEDRLVPLHPVYAIPVAALTSIKSYFEAKQGF